MIRYGLIDWRVVEVSNDHQTMPFDLVNKGSADMTAIALRARIGYVTVAMTREQISP